MHTSVVESGDRGLHDGRSGVGGSGRGGIGSLMVGIQRIGL